MIVLTGDTHRDFARIFEFCEEYGTTRDDILVILGDAGINYCLDESDEALKRELSQLEVTLLCVHGNHEERPFEILSYEEVEWHGGLAGGLHFLPHRAPGVRAPACLSSWPQPVPGGQDHGEVAGRDSAPGALRRLVLRPLPHRRSDGAGAHPNITNSWSWTRTSSHKQGRAVYRRSKRGDKP